MKVILNVTMTADLLVFWKWDYWQQKVVSPTDWLIIMLKRHMTDAVHLYEKPVTHCWCDPVQRDVKKKPSQPQHPLRLQPRHVVRVWWRPDVLWRDETASGGSRDHYGRRHLLSGAAALRVGAGTGRRSRTASLTAESETRQKPWQMQMAERKT